MVKKILNAFTLLELSIVLVIMVILTSITVDFSSRFLEQNRLNNTQLKLKKIQDALNAYLVANGKLPCPAGLKKSTGVALSSCSTTNSTDGVYVKDSVAKGWVPYETLDLTSDIVHDSWGNKISYIVANSATIDFYKIPNTFDGIKVYDGTESETPITNSAIYAIISHGKNGLGAYNKNNSQNSLVNISNEEKINSPIDLSSHKNNVLIYFEKPQKNKDDIGIYSTKIQTAIDNGLENISSYIDNTVINNLLASYGLSSADTVFSIPSNNFLQYGDYIISSNKKYKIKSYKYGKLELVNQAKIDDNNNLESKCNKASLLLNNAIFSNNSGYINVGESISFRCNECSTKTKTNLFATCLVGGLWSYNGYCASKTCNKSGLSYTNVTFTDKTGTLNCGDYISKSCNTGYTGSITATCNTSGGWLYSGSCTIITCENSNLSYSNTTFANKTGITNYNNTQIGSCNSGYTGTITATCQSNGTWNYSGSCTVTTCNYDSVTNGYWGYYDDGSVLPSGTASGTVPYGTKIKMMCNTGYLLSGTSVAECKKGDSGIGSDGWNWTSNNGTCVKLCDKDTLSPQKDGNIISTSPGVPGSKIYKSYSNAITSGTTYENGRYFANDAMIEASCNSGYQEISEGGQIDSTWGTHAYKCVSGEWKRMGTCVLKPSGSITFNYTGSQQTWTVPDGVTNIKIQVFGAEGGTSSTGYISSKGGYGGYAYGTLTVLPNDTIYIYVGGKGSSVSGSNTRTGGNGGWNGGGKGGGSSWAGGGAGAGGGGATDIRYGGTSLNDRKIVAGGGGGGAKSDNINHGYGGSGNNQDGKESFPFHGADEGPLCAMGGGKSGANGGGSGTICSNTSYCHIAGNSGTSGIGGSGRSGSGYFGGGGGGGGYIGGGAGTSGGCTGAYVSGGGGGSGSAYIGGVSNGLTINATSIGNGLARICWGDNTDCNTPTCNKSEINYENAFGSLTGTVTIGSSISSSCKSGYLGTITALCTNAGWKYRGNCILSAASCDRNTLRSSGDNIITSSPGVPGSKFHPTISGEATEDLRYFANGSMFNAYCDTGYNEVSTGGQIDSTWGTHAYKCVNGEWKRMGTCVPKASGSITFNYTGSQQIWTVPDDVYNIKIQVWGAQGGSDYGGKGGYSYGMLSVSPGNNVYVYVGGQGSSGYNGTKAGGWNGGGSGWCENKSDSYVGGGGGSTDVRYGGTSTSDRKIVAGGGGGGGYNTYYGGETGGFGGGGSSSGGTGTAFDSGCGGGGGTSSSVGTPGCICGNSGSGMTGGSTLCKNDAGGGGGYYGGASGGGDGDAPAAGGGGSGYIGGVTNGGGSNGTRSENGMARFCWGNNTDCD